MKDMKRDDFAENLLERKRAKFTVWSSDHRRGHGPNFTSFDLESQGMEF